MAFQRVFETFVSFKRIPLRIIIITALLSWALQVGALVQGQPLYIIALFTLLPWIPLVAFEGVWKYEHYSFMAVLALVTILQVGHLGEHFFQVSQLYGLNGVLVCPPPVDNAANAQRAMDMGIRPANEPHTGYSAVNVVHYDAAGQPVRDANGREVVGPPACGVFGQLDFETIHLVWDTLVWIGALWLLVQYPSNRWLWVSIFAASAHEIEHLFLGWQYFADTVKQFSYTHPLWATTANGVLVTAHPAGLITEPETFYEAGGKQGIMGTCGLVEVMFLGTPTCPASGVMPFRPVLHFGYNSLVVIPTVIGFLTQVRRAHNQYLAQALTGLSETQLISATPQLERMTFKAGQVVVRQGEAADHFYIISRGEAEVVREEADGQELVISRLGSGQYFGEIGLLHGGKRIATVRAAGDLEVLAFDRKTFNTLMEESEVTKAELERLARQRVLQVKALKSGGG